MYTDVQELLQRAIEENKPLSFVVLQSEMKLTEKTEEEVFAGLKQTFSIMEKSATNALEEPLNSVHSLITGVAHRQFLYSSQENSFLGPVINLMMARALSSSETNAAMGLICAAPTAGASGIVPAVILTAAEHLGADQKKVLEGLLTASGIGAIITRNATVSGAEGGCQAECGVAAAMAAAAIVEMAGGTPQQCIEAASFALINVMGLICDPIAGLVQLPCAYRNASQSINAFLSADLALAGQVCPIPLDEVIDAMFKTGKMLPMQLRETALGGIAATPTGRKLAEEIYKK